MLCTSPPHTEEETHAALQTELKMTISTNGQPFQLQNNPESSVFQNKIRHAVLIHSIRRET